MLEDEAEIKTRKNMEKRAHNKGLERRIINSNGTDRTYHDLHPFAILTSPSESAMPRLKLLLHS